MSTGEPLPPLAGLRRPDDDPGGVHVLHKAPAPGHHRDPRIPGHHAFHARAHQGRAAGQQRHRLALHVGAHQGPVGVVVLQEGDQGGGHAHQLVGGHVHVINIFGVGNDEFPPFPGFDHIRQKPPFAVQGGVGLGDDLVTFLQGAQVPDLLGDPGRHLAALFRPFHHPVGGFDEPQLVDPGKGGQATR